MAEHFRGRRLTVHTSNGGAEEMLRAWITLGERSPPTAERDAVLSFLRKQFLRGFGGRAFHLDPPPDEINSPAKLLFFARLVKSFAEELSREQPDPTLTESGGS